MTSGARLWDLWAGLSHKDSCNIARLSAVPPDPTKKHSYTCARENAPRTRGSRKISRACIGLFFWGTCGIYGNQIYKIYRSLQFSDPTTDPTLPLRAFKWDKCIVTRGAA